MDRRSLIFVIALTCVLFLINQWFGLKDKQRSSERKTQEQTQVSLPTESNLANRTASPSTLPIVPLISDTESAKVVTMAIKIDEQYLTISWGKDLPTVLYANPSSKKVEKLLLRIESNEKATPVLYSADQKLPLRVASLPEIAMADLQLVYFSDNNTEAHVVLGEFRDNEIFFPLQQPTKPCIALYNSEGEYLPAGVYDPSTMKFRLFTEYPDYGAIIKEKFFGVSGEKKVSEEKFYVLENDYQQLVFSNVGGSLSEINLPFYSEKNPHSVIRKIEPDRILQKDYPENDYFPARGEYQMVNDKGSIQVVSKGTLGGYYPLLRRDILGGIRYTTTEVPPHYYACSVISDDPETAALTYKVRRFEKNLIEFEASQANRKIIKTFSIPANPENAPYCFDLQIRVEGDNRNLFITSGIPEVELISGNWSPSLKYRLTSSQNKSQVQQLDLPKTRSIFNSVIPDWVSNSNGFFGIIMDPLASNEPGLSTFHIAGNIIPTRLSIIDSQYDLYPTQKYPGYEIHLPLYFKNKMTHFRIFAGPFQDGILKKVDAFYSDPSKGYDPDYLSTKSFHGWFAFISEPFAKFLFILMKLFYSITTSWGISLILLTIALRLMLYPLNAWSIRSSMKMQEISPQVTAIQQKYKKDPKRAQLEVMNIYRQKGVNPFMGCLPLLIQMPFLIGMFDLLKSTFDLRGAPFIRGWIDNLAAPDVLFTWKYPLMFVGTEFHLLPFILGVVMFIQQRLSSGAPKDAKLMTDQQRQQRAMGNVLTIVFTVMFYHFPSGLNIYWLSSMLLGIFQQYYMSRKKRIGPLLSK